MPSPTSSYLLTRSLSSTSRLPRPAPPDHEHINISTIDTPTLSLRNEILIGFLPLAPWSLVTLARPMPAEDRSCEIGLWHFHPQRRVELYQRFLLESKVDYLPIMMVSSAYYNGKLIQGVYRSANDDDRSAYEYGEGCIEMRCFDVSNEEKWHVWESVTEEDGLFGGTCFGMVKSLGLICASTASRVYFFTMEEREWNCKEDYWTTGKRCLIFEVDVYLSRVFRDPPVEKCATRIIGSTDKVILVINVFPYLKTDRGNSIFQLRVNPITQSVHVRSIVLHRSRNLNVEAKFLLFSRLGKRMTAHCCEDECRQSDTTVFKTWFARGEKRSLKELVWEYGGVIVDYWDHSET